MRDEGKKRKEIRNGQEQEGSVDVNKEWKKQKRTMYKTKEKQINKRKEKSVLAFSIQTGENEKMKKNTKE